MLLLLCVAVGAAEEVGQDSVQHKGKGTIAATLAKANPLAATGQTVEVVRWMSKRRQFTWKGVDYGVTGLPILYFSPNTGWNYGARLHWLDYSGRPYHYKLTLHWLRSTEGKYDYAFRMRVPRISGTEFGLILLVKTKRGIRARYYGLGNDSDNIRAYTDPQSPQFRDENYYHYILEKPRFIFSLLRQIYGPVSTSIGLGLERTDVSRRGQHSKYVDEAPGGAIDGFTGFVTLTLQWDTRDDDNIARQGVFHEWSYETSRNSLVGLFFEEIDFRRYTFTDVRYYRLSERLNLAHRTVFEALNGSVPLYAYGEIGGSRRVKGLGGGETLRGFDTQRFVDDVRFFNNAELRYHLYTMRFFRQYLEWHGIGFVDTGRVWPDLDQMSLGDLHVTGGAGLRLYWNSDFVIRLGLGVSSEQVCVGMKYRNIF